jgi:hypothetical protein
MKHKKHAPLSDKRIARERERFRANRESILHAAEAVVCRKGLSELVFELLLHFMEDLDVRLKSIVSGPEDPPAKLLAILREVIRFQAEKENLSRVFVLDPSFLRVIRVVVVERGKAVSRPEREFLLRLRDARQAVYAEAASVLQEGIAAGVFRALDVETAVFYLGAVVQGYLHEKFWRESKPDLENDVLNIQAFILRGIEARPQGQA